MKFKPIRFLVSFYFWLELFATSALMFVICLLVWVITSPFDHRRLILHKINCFWSDLVLFANPMWKAHYYGKEKINKKETYVMVSNHASGADILVIFSLYKQFKWVSKKSLTLFPFIGWNMLLSRYILIDRGSSSSIRKMIIKARLEIKKQNSVMIFPEGTRSKDGHLQVFKTGAFQIALDSGVPILPIVIKGTHHAIQKGGFLIHRNRNIQVVIMDPVPYSEFSGMDAKDLAKKVHELMKAELERKSPA